MDNSDLTIAQLRTGLDNGTLSAVGLVRAYHAAIARYDRPDPTRDDAMAADGQIPLNSIIVDNPSALDEARAADARRAAGETLGPLDGIPYTAKESYLFKGLTAAAGSPAFADLIAQTDAFTIERLRAGGAILLGLTTMPPMANGGMQRGLHGRAESPYNPDFLTSAFASGSSNGSGTATTCGFGAFGLGEETWSSGRAPASCNSLCAYTPSRGVISTRGNWPLVPTMDVVVPHTRSMTDMLELLEVIVAPDHTTRGDFWRSQPWVQIPPVSQLRPHSYLELATHADLAGKKLGVPRMYINTDPTAGTGGEHRADSGIGGPMGEKIDTRQSVIALWQQLRHDLEDAGAEIIDVDFPVVSNYEGDRPGAPTISTRGLVDPSYLDQEVGILAAWAWEDFLDANGDPHLSTLRNVDGSHIFPHPQGALPDRYHGFDDDIATYPQLVKDADWDHVPTPAELPDAGLIAGGVRALEKTRNLDLEDWMDNLGLDAVIFPAMADIGPADADRVSASADLAWRNGTWVANGNLVPRHLGIPTVTVPMGTMEDTGMPVGLTLAGRAWDDQQLLSLAVAVEATAPGGTRRRTPNRIRR